MTLDGLNILNLGVFQDYCITVVWEVLLADCFNLRSRLQADLIEEGCYRLRTDLENWYATQRANRPLEAFYEVNDLVPKMLGKPNARSLALKAAESGTFLEYCADLAARYQPKLERGRALVGVGAHLVRLREIIRTSPAQLSVELHQELVDTMKKAFLLRGDAGVPFHPKWHFSLDLVYEAGVAGNPAFYSTFLDESYNGKLAKVCRACHSQTFHARVLSNFRWAFSRVRRTSYVVFGAGGYGD